MTDREAGRRPAWVVSAGGHAGGSPPGDPLRHPPPPREAPGPPPPAAAAEVPVAERRLVSVLFADLVGFTAASQDRDPEETRELLTRYFELARERIERYGGPIEKFMREAARAVWGAPTA